MHLKASLHIHTGADLIEGRAIGYSVFELIDQAHQAGLDILAHTCHRFFVWDEAWAEYARGCGILLLPGVELTLNEGSSHVLIINCDQTVGQIKNFKDLEQYKNNHPEILVIAAHPNFNLESMGLDRLEEYWDLFDAVEHSWFYSRLINLNHPVEILAREKNKPLIATADVHNFNFKALKTDYAILELTDFTAEAVVRAVKNNQFSNVTEPKSLAMLIISSLKAVIMVLKLKLTIWLEDVKNK